ncbi:zinc finger BED domain-containing 4-like, partial [Brachionus plicatilis]
MLIKKQRKLDNLEEKKQATLRNELEKEINTMNKPINCNQTKITTFIKRDKVFLELDDLSDELSQSIESDEEIDDDNLTDLDAADIDLDDFDTSFINSAKAGLAFLPCAAHNIQLVIKHGLVLDEQYTKLIQNISRDIVSKSKVSTLIAEEVRKLELSLHKSVITRWNSILFMILSVLKLTEKDFKTIRGAMRNKTAKQKEIKRKFCLSDLERDMLEELKTVLELFEFVTNELQSNRVSISRVYPCFIYLKVNLIKNIEDFNYTRSLRSILYYCLVTRFNKDDLIENDIFKIATFLDPNFGSDTFEPSMQANVKNLVKLQLKLLNPIDSSI